MGVSSDMRSSRVRRQAAKKPNKERTVQVRFSDEELAALDAICSDSFAAIFRYLQEFS